MAIRFGGKPIAPARKQRFLFRAAKIVPAVISGAWIAAMAATVSAEALEINTSIKKVDRTGAIELLLPKGAMVAIGDKVRVSLSPTALTSDALTSDARSSDAPAADAPAADRKTEEANKTRWTVKALNGDLIVAIPDGEPLVMPEAGFAAQINTLANQPTAKEAAKADAAPIAVPEMTKQKEAIAPVALAPVKADAKPAMEQAPSEPEKTAPAMAEAKPEPKSDAMAKAREPAAVLQPDKSDMSAKAPETAPEPAQETPVVKDAPVAASEKMAVEPEKAATAGAPVMVDKGDQPDMAEKPKDKIEEKSEAKSEEKLELKGMMPDTATELAKRASKEATPAAEATPMAEMPAETPAEIAEINDCDHLAAHPFDPEAKVEGVSYTSLKAEAVIEACQQAIAQYPNEARFYSQLTRGLHKAGKMQEAFEATRKGAELGSGHSMAFLAVMFQQGQAVPQDQAMALSWFEKAAAKGNPAAMVFAAALHRDGIATPKDYGKAAAYYQQAADLDVAEAMTSLAVFLDRGQGVEKDPEAAANYFLKALKADDAEARKLLYEVSEAISMDTRKQIQARLKANRFYGGPIDGDFGTGTQNAMTLFRRAR